MHLKAFTIYNKPSKVSNATRMAITFVFVYEIYFLLDHLYFKYNLKNLE